MLEYLKKTYKENHELRYEKIYIAVDIHGTILEPSWDKTENFTYLGSSKEALQGLSAREDTVLIIWSSSYPEKLKMYQEKFKEDGIDFKYLNQNPEVESGRISCFETKPYYDILLDDKAGFEWTEWKDILNWLENERR